MTDDSQINLAIAKIEYPDREIDDHPDGWVIVPLGARFKTYDYVNDWADIGPIIEREKIDLNWYATDEWSATSILNDAYGQAETPTKAAALCYLKMKGES